MEEIPELRSGCKHVLDDPVLDLDSERLVESVEKATQGDRSAWGEDRDRVDQRRPDDIPRDRSPAMLYLTMFASAFLAATFVPLASEITLAVALAAGGAAHWLIAAATLGNTLGAVINWVLGRCIEHFRDRWWFPLGAERLGRAQTWFQRYGVWSLLLAWAPVAGDALTVIAGAMRVRLVPFLILVAIGKGVRYALLAVAVEGVATP